LFGTFRFYLSDCILYLEGGIDGDVLDELPVGEIVGELPQREELVLAAHGLGVNWRAGGQTIQIII
jgi:hypothetical protein